MLKRTLTLTLLVLAGAAGAQQDAVPTLVPPTPVIWPTAGAGAAAGESAVARIGRDGRVRVGILFNAAPFAVLNVRGEVAGMEADIARSMGELWGVDVDFVQVTRQSALKTLRSGAVDYLAAALVARPDERRDVEFCQSHYRGAQAVLLGQDDPATSLAQLEGRTLGVVAGARAEEALTRRQASAGGRFQVRSFYTLDSSVTALLAGEIDALVDSRLTLQDVMVPGRLRVLDEVLEHEHHALAVRPGDVAMRNLINRSLQYLTETGRMAEIHDANFPGSRLPHGQIPVWQGLGETAPTLPAPEAQPSGSTDSLASSVVARLEQGQPLRVTGLDPAGPDVGEGERRLAAWRLALAGELELRLGVTLQPVAGPGSAQVAGGAADLAVGVAMDWAWADQVDFSAPLLLHGERMLVPARSEVANFRSLRNQVLGVLASEAGSEARAQAWAASANAEIEIFRVPRDVDVEWHLLIEGDLDAVFADSLRLMAPLRASPDALKLTLRCPGCDAWYSRRWLGLALPVNDPEFRRRLEVALQGMWQDGSMAQLLEPLMPAADIADLLLQSVF